MEIVSNQALAFIQGLHSNRIVSCATEALATTTQEIYSLISREELGDDDVRALDNEELEPVKRLLEQHCLDSLQLSSIINGFQDLAKTDQSIRSALSIILRDRLNYQHPVILDCSVMPSDSDACPNHTPLRALLTGCDMLRLSNDRPTTVASILAIYAAVRSSALSQSRIAATADRVYNLKARFLSWDTALASRETLPALISRNTELARSAYWASITAFTAQPSPLLNLSPVSIVVLLTPTVHSSISSQTQAGSDPFEPLGRVLSRSHSRIRHVPYTVSAGLTSTHMAFLNRTSAVVLVLCNFSSAFTEAQQEFITAVRHAINAREMLPDTEPIRKAVLGAGDPRDLRGDWAEWWPVACYEYSPEALEAAAEVLAGKREAGTRLPATKG